MNQELIWKDILKTPLLPTSTLKSGNSFSVKKTVLDFSREGTLSCQHHCVCFYLPKNFKHYIHI